MVDTHTILEIELGNGFITVWTTSPEATLAVRQIIWDRFVGRDRDLRGINCKDLDSCSKLMYHPFESYDKYRYKGCQCTHINTGGYSEMTIAAELKPYLLTAGYCGIGLRDNSKAPLEELDLNLRKSKIVNLIHTARLKNGKTEDQ